MTRGWPDTRMLKLQLKLSSSGVVLNSFAISLSASTPRLRSSVSFRPFRSVSSRISLISLILPALTSSAILSMMASTVVVGGIWVISMHILAGHHIVPGAHLDAAAAILVNFTHLRFIVQDLAAAHEVRGGHGGGDIVCWDPSSGPRWWRTALPD